MAGRSYTFKRQSLVVGWAIVLAVLLSSCGSSPTTTLPQENPDAVPAAQSIVNALRAAQPSGQIPQHFQTYEQRDLVRNQDDFDVQTYFNVLTHLTLEPGQSLDYLYLARGLGGEPFVYARPEDRSPYTSLDECLAEAASSQGSGGEGGNSRDYLAHIVVDDTREGYFEFVALMIMGGQFYLQWHAAYNDATIVSDREALEAILSPAGATSEDAGLPADVREQARKIDLEPWVEFPDNSTAVVRLVTFSKWGGFVESKYTIRRVFPHDILEEDTTTLVEYDCGVMF